MRCVSVLGARPLVGAWLKACGQRKVRTERRRLDARGRAARGAVRTRARVLAARMTPYDTHLLVARVERRRDGARLRDCQESDDELHGVLHGDRDDVAGAHAGGREAARQGRDERTQLPAREARRAGVAARGDRHGEGAVVALQHRRQGGRLCNRGHRGGPALWPGGASVCEALEIW